MKANKLGETRREREGEREATTDIQRREKNPLYTFQTTVKYEKGTPRISRDNVSYEQTGQTGSTGLERRTQRGERSIKGNRSMVKGKAARQGHEAKGRDDDCGSDESIKVEQKEAESTGIIQIRRLGRRGDWIDVERENKGLGDVWR